RALRLGMWLDGFEERRPGVVGGWIEAGGAMLGVEIDLDGHAQHGPFIRDAGSPIVSGRYGLGWAASRRAGETTDGGVSWGAAARRRGGVGGVAGAGGPEPSAPPGGVASRGGGPIGCSGAGWLRVGWGARAGGARPPVEIPTPSHRAPRGAASLDLACEPVAT